MRTTKQKLSAATFWLLDKIFGEGPAVREPRDEQEARYMIVAGRQWLLENGLLDGRTMRTVDIDRTVDELVAARRQIQILTAAVRKGQEGELTPEAAAVALADAERVSE